MRSPPPAGLLSLAALSGAASLAVALLAPGEARGAYAEAIAASRLGHCVTLADGSVRCWWSHYPLYATPAPIPGVAGAVAVSGGGYHHCALLGGGTVSCWPDAGQGIDPGVPPGAPWQVPGLAGAVRLGSGGFHDCAILADGSAQCWGCDGYGELGDGQAVNTPACNYQQPYPASPPVAVVGLTDLIDIAGGDLHTCAVRSDGTVWCWGMNWEGALGSGGPVGFGVNQTTPVQVAGIDTAVAIAATSLQTCAILADGTAQCWGANDVGELGDGDMMDQAVPAVVSGLSGASMLAMGAYDQGGTAMSCALLSGGDASCWGSNDMGQLGDGTMTSRLTPVAVVGLAGAVGLAATPYTTCAIVQLGAVSCWGRDYGPSPAALAALSACAVDADCMSAALYCDGLACAPKIADGQPAASASACASGFLVDGICCDAACDNAPCTVCTAAAGAIQDGTCTLTAVSCGAAEPCSASACMGGACVAVSKLDGTTCDDGVCIAGACVADPSTSASSSSGASSSGAGGAGGSASSTAASSSGSSSSGGAAAGGAGQGGAAGGAAALSGGGCSASSSSNGGGAAALALAALALVGRRRRSNGAPAVSSGSAGHGRTTA